MQNKLKGGTFLNRFSQNSTLLKEANKYLNSDSDLDTKKIKRLIDILELLFKRKKINFLKLNLMNKL